MSVESTPLLSLNRQKIRFPSQTLVILHVTSCFIASAALVSSFSQLGSYYPYFIAPATVGFLAVLPFHIYLYHIAKEHSESDDPVFITRPWLVVGFILIPLWVIIFFINILFCVDVGVPGVIITTVWSGLEWIVLLCISIRSMVEVWKAEKHADLPKLQDLEPPSKPHYIYFASFTLCTLALLFAIGLSPVCPFNVLVFFLTGPHHIALFVASVRRRRGGAESTPFPLSILFQPTSVPYAFGLAAVWCGIFMLDIVGSSFEVWQVALMALFAGMECILVGYLAFPSVLDSLAVSQIKL